MKSTLQKRAIPKLPSRYALVFSVFLTGFAINGIAADLPTHAVETQQAGNFNGIVVKGTVTDSKGLPIPGATVKDKNTGKARAEFLFSCLCPSCFLQGFKIKLPGVAGQ